MAFSSDLQLALLHILHFPSHTRHTSFRVMEKWNLQGMLLRIIDAFHLKIVSFLNHNWIRTIRHGTDRLPFLPIIHGHHGRRGTAISSLGLAYDFAIENEIDALSAVMKVSLK